MNEKLYVATDSDGVEHAPGGHIRWRVPGDTPAASTEHLATDSAPSLTLRTSLGLLEVLDECIYRAKSDHRAAIGPDGTATVDSAQLVERTSWNTYTATSFALDCAEHSLADLGDVPLPDGTPLAKVIADARQMLEGVEAGSGEYLGYLARLRALRRLKKERKEISDVSFAVLSDDEARDIEALDDPDYAALRPLTDSVLAAIEALRHHVVPRLLVDIDDKREEREEHHDLDRQSPMPIPGVHVTPFGPYSYGGGSVSPYEPAWTSAREAARHARDAAKDRGGAAGQATELHWQAAALAELLEK